MCCRQFKRKALRADCLRARHQLTIKCLRHQPDRARFLKIARGCSSPIARILAGIDDSPELGDRQEIDCQNRLIHKKFFIKLKYDYIAPVL